MSKRRLFFDQMISGDYQDDAVMFAFADSFLLRCGESPYESASSTQTVELCKYQQTPMLHTDLLPKHNARSDTFMSFVTGTFGRHHDGHINLDTVLLLSRAAAEYIQ